MSERRWGRLRPKGRREGESDADDNVRLDEDEHSWWAASSDGTVEDTPARDEPATGETDDAPGETNGDPNSGATASSGGPRTAEELRDAFKKKRRSPEEPAKKSSFDDYYSADSLFSSVDDPPVDPDVFDSSDPYVVLGVSGTSTWEQIMAAHRRLAKLHHPDRLLNAAADDRDRSEVRMREINIAYAELKRRRGK